MLKKIFVNNEYVALFIPNIKTEKRIEFFTEPDDLLQVAAFSMQRDQLIQPHLHLEQKRSIKGTNEILFVQTGELIVNFYKDRSEEVIEESVSLSSGDLIYLKSGIHGFKIGQDCKFIEIKQGPFVDGEDKVKLY
tara:strand:- start:7120 stop:7524 length:405 start_codon:yes stop_codon:yes gene_type:complete